MKPLSETQARRCENARGKRCSCRCRKACHGRALFARDSERENWESLPASDPHHLEPKMPKEKRVPERYRNLTPERAANMLLHAQRYVYKTARDWALFPGDISVAADVGALLTIAASKVRLGVDEIRA